MIVYLYAILSCFYASIEGIREAFYYHALKGSKSQNLHGIYWFQRLIFAIFLYVATNFFILTFFVLIFSFFHNGFYFLTRNRLDRLIYPKKFIDFSTTSTAIMEFNFIERSILFLIGLISLILNIIFSK